MGYTNSIVSRIVFGEVQVIPSIIHQIWVGPEPIPLRERGFRQLLKMKNPLYEHNLYRDSDVEYLAMPEKMQTLYDAHYKEKKWAFCADVLRIWVTYKFGGFYCDIDFEPIKSLDEFLEHDGVFCYHPTQADDFTIVNGFWGASKEHPIFKHLVEATQNDAWWVGPEFVGREVKKYFGLPYEMPQNAVQFALMTNDFTYFDWKKFDETFMKHHALYSWK